MKKRMTAFICVLAAIVTLSSGCGKNAEPPVSTDTERTQSMETENNTTVITPNTTVIELESGLSAVKYEGNSMFDEFLAQGGASSDAAVVAFLSQNLFSGANGLSFDGMPFGCSTISVKDENGDSLFGRNFDWNTCSAMIVQSKPESGYASISTVNTDFINMSGMRLSDLPDQAQAVICLYAPLDGMNEKGLAVSVNMIQDNATIDQDTDKPDITTTTAIRLLLDQAADADEAVELLQQYDMHASMGYMMHICLLYTSDAADEL